jgi:hypothetical protein
MFKKSNDIIQGTPSARAGTRRTRTKEKTAKAMGLHFTPVMSWRSRSQLKSTKMVKQGQIRAVKKGMKEAKAGDTKRM